MIPTGIPTSPGVVADWPEPVVPINERGGRRYYPCPDGVLRVSVTTVLKQFGLGQEGLVGWAARTEKAATLEAVRRVYSWAASASPDAFVGMVEKELGDAKSYILERDAAGDVGKSLHEMIRWQLQSEVGLDAGPQPMLSDAGIKGWTAWARWWKASGLVPIVVEQFVWNEQFGFAGQLDLVARAPDGATELIDWKSSKYLLAKHHVQAVAYKAAAESLGHKIDRVRIVKVPKMLSNLNIEVAELGHYFDLDTKRRVVRSERQLFQAFLGALAIDQAMVEQDTATDAVTNNHGG